MLCNATARYGDARYGKLTDVFNEADYLTISPCLFGFQEGLQEPVTLTPDTPVTAIQYFNTTYRHLGQMALWTGLLTYQPDHTHPYAGARGHERGLRATPPDRAHREAESDPRAVPRCGPCTQRR